jgi:hypothetical protein
MVLYPPKVKKASRRGGYLFMTRHDGSRQGVRSPGKLRGTRRTDFLRALFFCDIISFSIGIFDGILVSGETGVLFPS